MRNICLSALVFLALISGCTTASQPPPAASPTASPPPLPTATRTPSPTTTVTPSPTFTPAPTLTWTPAISATPTPDTGLELYDLTVAFSENQYGNNPILLGRMRNTTNRILEIDSESGVHSGQMVIVYFEGWVKSNYDGKYHLVKMKHPTMDLQHGECRMMYQYLRPGESRPFVMYLSMDQCLHCETTAMTQDTEPTPLVRQLVYTYKPFYNSDSSGIPVVVPQIQNFRYTFIDDMPFFRFEMMKLTAKKDVKNIEAYINFFTADGRILNILYANELAYFDTLLPAAAILLAGGDKQVLHSIYSITPGAACAAVAFDRTMIRQIDRVEPAVYRHG